MFRKEGPGRGGVSGPVPGRESPEVPHDPSWTPRATTRVPCQHRPPRAPLPFRSLLLPKSASRKGSRPPKTITDPPPLPVDPGRPDTTGPPGPDPRVSDSPLRTSPGVPLVHGGPSSTPEPRGTTNTHRPPRTSFSTDASGVSRSPGHLLGRSPGSLPLSLTLRY